MLKKSILIGFLYILFFSILPGMVFAVSDEPSDCGFSKGTGVPTAIGCIYTDPSRFITSFLSVGVGIGGGIAFLMILFGGFQILTSAGDPERLTAGRELVTSAITGLLLIIFSMFLLRLIGYNILRIPGFG